MIRRKRNILELIRYEGPQDAFVWKHDCEDFNTKSQLIVNESQEAVFFKDGKALDSFLAGRYTLDTKNLPFLRDIISIPIGGTTPFRCEIYYINKNDLKGLKWGTNSAIEMMDPLYNVPIQITANGGFSLQVEEGRKLLIKLVGIAKQFTYKEVEKYFADIMETHIRDCISNAIKNPARDLEEGQKSSALDINNHLVSISEKIQKQLTPIFEEYGLRMKDFSIASIKLHGLEEIGDAERRKQIKKIDASVEMDIEQMKTDVETERIQKVSKAKNAAKKEDGIVQAQINREKGISEQEHQAFEVAKELAKNTGPNSVIGGSTLTPTSLPWIGTGAVIQSPAGKATDIVKTVFEKTNRMERTSGNRTEYFEEASDGRKGIAERVEILEMLYAKKMISEERYKAKIDEIMNEI